MQEQHLYEYAVIRIVPSVEREEFLNVGVILYSRPQKFLGAMFTLNEEKLRALAPHTDINTIRPYLEAFVEISKGSEAGGPIGKLDMPSRFRWLTAMRSSVVQTSRVHPGFCSGSAADTLQRLHEQLVL
ncbi:DUF3037 family protein [Chitinophaga polysaccharea]|uniref:DUF3037 domain-containing protein n=2 Tax=Chitinophaga TaxID=79328 RepID=A0A847SMP4_9BACT|nr:MULTISPECIES: DUF3037 domain-containing protein [Chitinophaga]NLR81464.1 DUF3037 domain-containing protein [Chitinophaga eiseniae]TWF35809.1 DUF3037 family protein [Chitinophaga polysaccharea]